MFSLLFVVSAIASRPVVAICRCSPECRSGSGSLVKEEIGKLFSTNGIPLGPQELDDVMAEVDDDGGGDVSTIACFTSFSSVDFAAHTYLRLSQQQRWATEGHSSYAVGLCPCRRLTSKSLLPG